MERTDPTDSQPITKGVLAMKYSVSNNKMRQLLNVDYFKELQEVGYTRNQKLLPPKVVNKFIEIYGEPLHGKDI